MTLRQMAEVKQTLGGRVAFSGVGAHTGRIVRAALNPSESGTIVFRRQDKGGLSIAVDPARAWAQSCTLLSGMGACVRTVEHLLASLLMCGIDSAEIDLDGEEVPILDGSALPFVRLLLEAGKRPLRETRNTFDIVEPLTVEGQGGAVTFEPGQAFDVIYAIDYKHPAIGRQELRLRLDAESFRTQIAPARTFGFLKDAEKLKAMGMALGSSTENTLVLDDDGVVNPPLRFPDEFVRHKILDLVGDLALLGAPLRGRVRALRAGHDLHLRAVRALLHLPAPD